MTSASWSWSCRSTTPCTHGRSARPPPAESRRSAELQVGQDLAAGPDALRRATLHETLEILGAVLAGEVDVALALLLVPAERGVLADTPVRVGEVQVRIEGGYGQRRLAIPKRSDVRVYRLELAEECLRIGDDRRVRRVRVRGCGLERARNIATGVVDEDAARAGLGAGHIPGVLIASIRIAVAVADARPLAGAVPQARAELELELVIPAAAQLLDRGLLERVEARFRVVERAKNSKGQGQHDLVRHDRRLHTGEAQGVASVLLASDRRHPPARPDRRTASGQIRCDRLRQPFVATDDVVALVGQAEDREVPGSCLVAEQVDEVQGGLVGGLRAVLDVVADIEKLPEGRSVTARNARVDPVVDAHVVEGHPARRVEVVERRITGRLDVTLERVVDGLEVAVGLVLWVVRPEEPVRVLRAVRFGAQQVDGRQLVALGQHEDRLVVRVDELAAPLARLALVPVAAGIGMHSATDPIGRLVDGARDTLVGEGQGGGEAGDPATDDRDAGSCSQRGPGKAAP